MKTPIVLSQIGMERAAQDEKWGEQNHPDGTSEEYRPRADEARSWCKSQTHWGLVTWIDILNEEVQEAFTETDSGRLRAELVQVAAVAVAWIEAIDRKCDGAEAGG